MNSVNIANTSIDIHSGCIGISASGGANSAILLYILMANLDSHSVLHTFTGQADSGNSGWPSKVNDFVKRCTELTGFGKPYTVTSADENTDLYSLVQNLDEARAWFDEFENDFECNNQFIESRPFEHGE